MMTNNFSFSKISTFKQCEYKFFLKYILEKETLPNYDPDNALILGTAIHTAIEKDTWTAISEYFKTYPIITDQHINWSMIIEDMGNKAKKLLPKGKYEVEIKTEDFIGYIDLLTFENDIYDFKFTNNGKYYEKSPQVAIYKYFAEKQGLQIRNLYYLIIPKPMIRQKKTESIYQFRKRLEEELKGLEPKIIQIDYYEKEISDFLEIRTKIETKGQDEKDYIKNESNLCNYCEFKNLCKNKNDYEII